MWLESVRKSRFVLPIGPKDCDVLKFMIVNNSFQEAIFRVVAAVLHLGNIEFTKGKEIDSSIIKNEKSRFHLNITAELLKYAHLLVAFILKVLFCLSYLCFVKPNIIFCCATAVMPRVWKMQ